MKRKSLPTNSFWDAIPEIDQHEVRYSEYILKSPKNPVLPTKRQTLPYGVGPTIDCEIDDDNVNPDYSKYTLPRFDIETPPQDEKKTEKKQTKKKEKKLKAEISLDSIYAELHEMKLTKIHKIIKENKLELVKAQNNRPNMSLLSVAKRFYSTMFNPDQKYWIYMYVREVLNISPYLFRENPHLYTVLAPVASIIIFQKQFKIDTKYNAVGKLAELELLNPTFYSDKANKEMYCRT